ncbi:MAG: prolyl oligopeptidase family serine peptidase [Gemmatimonadaceae bacterium]
MSHRPLRAFAPVALAASTLLIPTVAAHAQQRAGRAFTLDDALAVRTSRIDDVSKDGRWIALSIRVRRDGLGIDNARYGDATYVAPSLAEFQLIDATTGKSQAILPGKVDVRGAKFSKDGKSLAFFLRKGDDYALEIDDIASNHTRAVALHTTKQVASSSELVWAPDSKSVLIALRPDGWATSAHAAFVHLTTGEIVVQDAKDPFLAWDAVRNMGNRQVTAAVTIADGTVRELLPTVDMRGPQFAGDASYIVYSTNTQKKTSYDNTGGTDYGVFRLTLSSGKVDTLVKPTERRITPRWNDDATAFAYADRGNVFVRRLDGDSARNLTAKYRKPESKTDTTRTAFTLVDWRPDGGALLVSTKDGYHMLDPRTDSMSLVYQFEADTAARPSRTIQAWSHDGRYLFLGTSAKEQWARGIERYDIAARKGTALASDVNVYAAMHVSDDGSRFVFERSDGDRPNEVYTAGRDFSDAHALTNLNPQLAGVSLSHSELVSYLDVDGKTLKGVLYYPYGYQPGKKYPLVAEIYETFFDNGFNENMNLLAARGWFVFHPSVDLQIGYPGEAWVKGVTDGINSLEQRGLVDGTKLGVEGQSYGGYATNLLITQTDRFKAAVNISGKVDVISFLGDSPKIGTRNYNAAEKGQDRIGESLWQAPMKYIAHSAIFYADRIKTPLLMLTGKEDWNVPSTNEREMYYALRRLGREAVWVEYAGAGHGAGRAGNENQFKDHWNRIFEWFGGHFDKPSPATVPVGQTRNPAPR